MRLLTPMLLILATLFACEEPAEPLSEPDGTYTTRGRIAEVAGGALAIHHEAIPTFRNREGEQSGMHSMTMRFAVPEELSTEGLEAGDPVELTFDVRWSGEHTLTISAIEELPADTALELTEHH